jgi:DNA replication protein DnaC
MEAEDKRRQLEAEEAERQARIEKHLARCRNEASELQHEIGGALFDTNPEHPDIDGATMQQFLEWFIENNELEPRPLNGTLTGPPGTGKSRALAAAAVAQCQRSGRENVEWITGYEFAELVSSLSTEKRDEATARLKTISEAYWLFFDDLGSSNFTKARLTRLFSLIDERYRRHLPTFFSTEYTTPQLKKKINETKDSKDASTRILRRIIGTTNTPLAKFFHFKRPQK